MDFEGDVLLTDTLDSGEIFIENGEIICDKGFRTAIYLSIMGGDKDDDGTSNNTWWGNNLNNIPENEKLISRFQNVIRNLPLTSANLKIAENAIKEDLNWILEEEIADKINISLKMENSKKISVEINILKNGEKVEKSKYSLQWGEMNGI